MPFDSRSAVAALEPPVFIAPDGATYTGRILSYVEYQRVKPDILRWAEGRFGEDETEESVIRRLLDAIGIPAEPVLALPMETVTEALLDFFGPRRRAAPAAAPAAS